MWLSVARAITVRDYMVKDRNLSEKYLEASGWGELHPIASNKTEAGRSKNRRVEIKIYSDTE